MVAQAQSPTCREGYTPPIRPFEYEDRHHPRLFVQIAELSDTAFAIHHVESDSTDSDFRDVSRHLDHQVDRDSRIFISFDRDALRGRNATIEIRGRVLSADGTSHPIEIPGYSEIGEQNITEASHLPSRDEVFALLNHYVGHWCNISAELDSVQAQTLRASTVGARLEQVLRERELAGAERARRADIISRIARSTLEEDLAAAASAEAAVAARQKEAARMEEMRLARESLVAAELVLQQAENRLQDALAAEEIQNVLQEEYVGRARARLLGNRDALVGSLQELVASPDSVWLHVIAAQGGQHPHLLARDIEQIRIVWFDSLAAAGEVEDMATTWMTAMENIRRILNTFVDVAARSYGNPDATDTMIAERLKETEIAIANTGAKVGDRIVIEVLNHTQRGELPRKLEVTLPVTEFGWIQRLSDSFLLVNRAGANDKENADLILEAGERLTSGNESEELELPSEVVFQPTPSFTYGWNFNPRIDPHAVGGGARFRRFIDWLEPGLGINVAFPSFETRYVTLVKDSTGAVSERPREFRRNINLGVGVVGTLFSNTIVVGWGRHLTAQAANSYWMLGLSFVQVVEGVLKTGGS